MNGYHDFLMKGGSIGYQVKNRQDGLFVGMHVRNGQFCVNDEATHRVHHFFSFDRAFRVFELLISRHGEKTSW